jgi:hypothetical protein
MPTPVQPRDGPARHRGDARNGVRILVKRGDVGGSASAAPIRSTGNGTGAGEPGPGARSGYRSVSFISMRRLRA